MHLSTTRRYATSLTLYNMATFEKLVLAVYYQVVSLLIIPMSLTTKLFIADEDDW